MLTGSKLHDIPRPGSGMPACHYMLEPVAGPHWVDHHCCQLLPKHALRVVSSVVKSHR